MTNARLPSGAITACHGSAPSATSPSFIDVGDAFCGYASASTVAGPTSRLTTTAIASSDESAIAEPRLGPGATVTAGGPSVVARSGLTGGMSIAAICPLSEQPAQSAKPNSSQFLVLVIIGPPCPATESKRHTAIAARDCAQLLARGDSDGTARERDRCDGRVAGAIDFSGGGGGGGGERRHALGGDVDDHAIAGREDRGRRRQGRRGAARDAQREHARGVSRLEIGDGAAGERRAAGDRQFGGQVRHVADRIRRQHARV